jgi:hypothetical protein
LLDVEILSGAARDRRHKSVNPAGLNPQLSNVSELSADKGYLSYANARAITDAGATPFIKLKENSTIGDVHKIGFRKSQAWTDMYCRFASNRDEFLRRYHLRYSGLHANAPANRN